MGVRKEKLLVSGLFLVCVMLSVFLIGGDWGRIFLGGDGGNSETGGDAMAGAMLDSSRFDSVYADGREAVSLSASHAALLTSDGELLFGMNENTPAGMASTTKIMTGLLAAEYIQAVGEDAMTAVSAEASGIEGSSIYLKVGERVRLVDLLYATLLASANDAAAALAEAVAGDIPSFVAMMNRRAAGMGLENTHFENPHGLASAEHYTTAKELGVLTAEALQNPLFARVVATKNYTFAGEGIVRSLSNHNRLLSSYEGAIGVKTGFTRATGRCLVSAACRDGITLIAVTLNAPDDWRDHSEMLDYGFSCLERVTLAESGAFSFTLPVVGGVSPSLTVENTEEASAVFSATHGEITHEVELPAFLYAPIEKGDAVGRVVFYENGREVGAVSLVAQESVGVKEHKKSFWERIFG